MVTSTEIQGRFDSSIDGTPGGISCRFFELDNTIGLKTYYRRYERDFCFAAQMHAWEHNLGPEPYETLEIGQFSCLTTELAPSLCPHAIRNTDNRYKFQAELAMEWLYRQELENLEDNLEALFNGYCDMHIYNAGWLKGQLVCIDFGTDGIENWEEWDYED